RWSDDAFEDFHHRVRQLTGRIPDRDCACLTPDGFSRIFALNISSVVVCRLEVSSAKPWWLSARH
ncbi:MAG: hypothetical protein ACREV1_11535, partial [Gammaproteobacteria bacterium]